MTTARIALDAMGGDDAPAATVAGALRAVEGGLPAERLILVGDQARLEKELAERGGNSGFELVHASQVIEMGDSPSKALRAKPDSSIGHCVRLVREGAAASVVSMGNTGACVGAATLGLGTLEGVRRPGIAVTLALDGNPITILDMGANIAPKADHLAQYGAMGAVYMRDCLGIERPRIGLLNVGEERGKGTDVLKEAHELFERQTHEEAEFVGNIEGSDIFRGAADVIVTDGFTGNVILKLLEQFASFLLGLVMVELKSHEVNWGPQALGKVKQAIDYSTYGGALLLGVRGVVVIGHGRSDEKAVANALVEAARAVDAQVNAHIEQGLAGPRTVS